MMTLTQALSIYIFDEKVKDLMQLMWLEDSPAGRECIRFSCQMRVSVVVIVLRDFAERFRSAKHSHISSRAYSTLNYMLDTYTHIYAKSLNR